jgi:hypothetical protein
VALCFGAGKQNRHDLIQKGRKSTENKSFIRNYYDTAQGIHPPSEIPADAKKMVEAVADLGA